MSSVDSFRLLRKKLCSYGPPIVIAVSGATQSGKTFYSAALTRAFVGTGLSSVTVPLDNYFRDLDDPKSPRDGNGRVIYDVPDAYHGGEFLTHVTALKEGRPVRVPFYDKATNRRVADKAVTVMSAHVVIAEGLFAGMFLAGLRPPVWHIFMDTPMEVCRARRIKTDADRFGVTPGEVEACFDRKIVPYWHLCQEQIKLATIIITHEGGGESGCGT